MRTSALISCLLALLVFGCQKASPTADDHGHDHGPGGHSHAGDSESAAEEKTAQLTVRSGGYEIFAEHQAPLAGMPTRIITHITSLATGEPRRSGLIKFILEQSGGPRFEHPQAAPDRPGIYLPAITFPSAGDWRAHLLIPGEPDTTIELGTFKVFPNAAAAQNPDFPAAPEGISFLKEQQWRILARHHRVQKQRLVERVPLHAAVVPAPGSKATVHAQITGLLLAEGTRTLGATVKAGEAIAWLQPAVGEFSSNLIDAEAAAIRTRATLEEAQAAFDRTRRLFEQQAKSEREMKEAEIAFRTAKASAEAAAAIQKLYAGAGSTNENGLLKVALASPIDGTIDRVFAGPGARVTPDDPVFAIINDAAYVVAQVPETRLPQIDLTLGGEFLPVGSTTSIPIKLVARGLEIDSQTRTLPLTFKFEQGHQPPPLGSIGTLLAGTRAVSDALTVPLTAVVDEDGVSVVFVQLSGETYEKRDVTLGVRAGNLVQVTSGLAEGEWIATEGAYAILLSTKSGTIPAHGHAH